MIPKCNSTSGSGIRSSACDCLFGIVFVATLALLVCATPTILRLLILLQPTPPHFSLHSSSLANINATTNSSSFTANWHPVLSLRNPNRNPISYHGILATSLVPPLNNITTLPIPSFVHKGNNVQQQLQLAFLNTSLHFTNCTSSHGYNYNASCGALNLTMELQARAQYGGWTWPLKTDTIKVVCRQDVEVQFPLVISLNFDSPNSSCDVSGGWKTLVTNWNSLFWKYLYFVIVFLGILAVSL